jgi:hypothetical protein
MLSSIEYNNVFQLAADYINFSNRSVFLTGKAGTGKTTFLKFIRESTSKEVAVLAPTGVAAINAGGTTIHSFFQLPLGPYVPSSINSWSAENKEATDKHHLLGRLRYTKEKIQLLQALELLIIDEISMVRCDVLDEIDVILRYYRNRYHEPFGGVQMLFIGDMYQLPPVAVDDEWRILSQFYSSPYFFDSDAIRVQPPQYIELEKIYRQSDLVFVDLLNKIRNNEMDEAAAQLLRNRYVPSQQHGRDRGSITLTTHNRSADNINAVELQNLQGKLFEFKATITGEFYEKSFPADEMLKLKIGAQVMYLKNDMEKPRRYFNGKIGTVQRIEDEEIFVQSADEEPIALSKYKWENVRYSFNGNTQKVEEDVIGSFEQFPLRLAWAITIHKSQGLTFEKAVIDAGAAFAPGQVYVALSRCTSLEGIILHSTISQRALFSDERIKEFSKNRKSVNELPLELLHAKHQYQQKILIDLFDFSRFILMSEELFNNTEKVKTSFNEEAISWIQKLIMQIESTQSVAQKFQSQLQQLMQQAELPENNKASQQRIKAASEYFAKELQSLLQTIAESPAVTDSYLHASDYNAGLKNLHAAVAFKLHLVRACAKGFAVSHFLQQKKNFHSPSFNISAYSKASSSAVKQTAHPELYKQLRKLRDEICEREKLSVYLVAGSKTLEEMTNYLPQNSEELIKISGFGKAKAEKYGEQFLNMITEYCAAHNLDSRIEEKVAKKQRKEKKEPKPDTKLESLRLYKEGKSVLEIASARNLATSTIETHLAHYVKTGDIKIDELVSREKIVLIEPVIKNMDGISIAPIKEKLGNDVSYGEIKLVMAYKEFQKSQSNSVE